MSGGRTGPGPPRLAGKTLMRTPLVLLTVVSSIACVTAAPIHPRALELCERCSRSHEQHDLVQAETYCDLGLEFSPQSADLWNNKGVIAREKEKLSEAKDDFIKALRYNSEHAQAFNNLGTI